MSLTIRGRRGAAGRMRRIILISVILILLGTVVFLLKHGDKRLPPFTILYTGDTYNYIEPCGCCRKQTGGLPRRAAVAKKYKGKSILLLDNGNLVDYYMSNQTRELEKRKLLIMNEALKIMRYDGINIGKSDMFLPREISMMKLENEAYISCNVEFKGAPLKPYMIKKIGDGFVGVIGVTEAPGAGCNVDYECENGRKALEKYLREIRKKVSFVIILSQLGEEENKKIVGEFPFVNVIICREGVKGKKEGKTFFLPTRRKGEYLGKADVRYNEGIKEYEVDAEMIPLSEDVRDDKDMRTALDELYKKHLGITIEDAPVAGITAKECGECHKKEYEKWQKTKHAIAFDDLVNKGRGIHPGCVDCHADLEEASGDLLKKKIYRSRLNIQCVVCHRKNGKHYESGRKVVEKDCIRCHDKEHSRDFCFRIAVKKIAH